MGMGRDIKIFLAKINKAALTTNWSVMMDWYLSGWQMAI
jgi:hypothetical protein